MNKKSWLAYFLCVISLTACGTDPGPDLTDTGSDSGGGNDTTDTDPCAGSPTFTNGQSASFVIGQASLTSGTSATSATEMNSPTGNASLIDSILYVPDTSNHRILGYSTLPSSNGASADFALGQANLTSGGFATSATGLNQPQRIQKYDGKYYVLDLGNNRLLRYDTAPNTSGAAASAVVVGNPSLTTASSGCTDKRLSGPEDFLIVGGKLYIADAGNNRVLGWNTIPTAADTPADFVLGQPDMTTCGAGSTTASSLYYPRGIASDGTKLVISDKQNNRVLVWNTLPATTAQAANSVIGQSSMTGSGSNDGGLSASSLYEPAALAIHSGKLYVVDNYNNRVLVYNAIPTSDTAAADRVIGQANFISDNGAITAAGLDSPSGVFVCGTRLFVSQINANRVSVFVGN